jgi:hypothetical protein
VRNLRPLFSLFSNDLAIDLRKETISVSISPPCRRNGDANSIAIMGRSHFLTTAHATRCRHRLKLRRVIRRTPSEFASESAATRVYSVKVYA